MLSCYQCNGSATLCENETKSLFCTETHRTRYNQGWATLLANPLFQERLSTHLGMKRGAKAVTTTTTTMIQPHILEVLPEEVMGEILLYTFHDAENDAKVMKAALDARETSVRLATLIDQYIIRFVRRLSREILRSGVIGDDTVLALFTGLQSIDLTMDLFSDEGVAKMTSLLHLDIDYSVPLSNTCLKGLTKLESLTLTDTNEINEKGFVYVPQLKKLYIGFDTSVISFEPLTCLEELIVESAAYIHSALFVPLAASLRKLVLPAVNCSQHINMGDIVKLTKLESLALECGRGNIVAITEELLGSMTNLTELRIDASIEMNDEILTKLTGLTFLTLRKCKNVRGTALKHLTKLSELRLSYIGVGVTELTPLTQLKKLFLERYSCAGAFEVAQLPPHLEAITLTNYHGLDDALDSLCRGFPMLREITVVSTVGDSFVGLDDKSIHSEIRRLKGLYPLITFTPSVHTNNSGVQEWYQ